MRLLNGKTPTTEWHLAETVDNKLKALELLQVGVSYMHYANKTRKDALFDMRADHERRIKEVTQVVYSAQRQEEKAEGTQRWAVLTQR